MCNHVRKGLTHCAPSARPPTNSSDRRRHNRLGPLAHRGDPPRHALPRGQREGAAVVAARWRAAGVGLDNPGATGHVARPSSCAHRGGDTIRIGQQLPGHPRLWPGPPWALKLSLGFDVTRISAGGLLCAWRPLNGKFWGVGSGSLDRSGRRLLESARHPQRGAHGGQGHVRSCRCTWLA